MKKILAIIILLPSLSFAQSMRADLVRAQQIGVWTVGLGTSPISVNMENVATIVKSTAVITTVDTPSDVLLSTSGWTHLTPFTLVNRTGVYVTNYLDNTMTANIIITSFTAANLGISTNTATVQLFKGDSVSLGVGEQISIWGHSTTLEEKLCVTQY